MSALDGGRQPPRAPSCTHSMIDIQDASRVLECSQTDRQIRFQHLVRRYHSQISYGCKSAYCDTPTCFSCHRRNASKPFRPPTQLTARALAHFLASQDDPHRGLCPHELKVAPNAFEFDVAYDCGSRHGSNRGDPTYNVYPSLWTLAQQHRFASTGERGDVEIERRSIMLQNIVEATSKRRQLRKDTKSLAQNLYDSVTMIHALSRQIPNPTSVLASLRSSEYDGKTIESTKLPPPENEHFAKTQKASNTRIVRRHSQLNLRARSKSQAEPAPARILDDGHQIHRIPYHHRGVSDRGYTSKTSLSSTFNSASDETRASATKNTMKKVVQNSEFVPTMRISKSFKSVEETEQKQQPGLHRTKPPLPVFPILDCDILDELKKDGNIHHQFQSAELDFVLDQDSNRRLRPAEPSINRSLFFALSDMETLLKSFRSSNEAFSASPLPHLDSTRLTHSFRDWNHRNGALIFDSLWITTEVLFTHPLLVGSQNTRYLDTKEAAHIVMICIHALTSSVPIGWPQTWAQLRKLRSRGVIVPNTARDVDPIANPFINIIDELDFEPAVRLVDRLLGGIGARTCAEHIVASAMPSTAGDKPDVDCATKSYLIDVILDHLIILERVALDTKQRTKVFRAPSGDPGWTVTATLLEWLKTIIIKKWDCKIKIAKWSSVGTAVMLLDRLHARCEELNLNPAMFEMPFFSERLDSVDEPTHFLKWEKQPNTLHIFEYPNLFPTLQLVAYFRTINFTRMMEQYDHTTRTHHMKRSLEVFLQEPHSWVVKYRMKVTLSEHLVLNVSRADPLKDTLDQVWGQERRMLLKPLKVQMGQQEGEVGQDHGGVTYEFFRVVLSEAFKPDNGMFTIDPQTRMTWFQPCSLEPLWKFEIIGVLFSLAIYNGITLPVTFPLVFYHFLLSVEEITPRLRSFFKNPLHKIKDGWPDLHKAFQELLTWTDDDVGDVIMRDYAFSFDFYGQRVDHNMKYPFCCRLDKYPWYDTSDVPATALHQDEPELVTNDNRSAFVKDYVRCLTYSSVAPQLQAFNRGFYACIEPKSLTFFNPKTLRDLIEGSQSIDVSQLRKVAKYEDGYTPTHSSIRNFWSIIETYNQDDCRQLLEFVTASDRVPVTGYESIVFHIVRTPGGATLPSSSTCFGKLYLPDYQDEETMRGKLEIAIQNSKGFGVA